MIMGWLGKCWLVIFRLDSIKKRDLHHLIGYIANVVDVIVIWTLFFGFIIDLYSLFKNRVGN